MPEHEVTGQQKQGKTEKNKLASTINPQAMYQNLMAWDISSYLGEPVFNPPIQRHSTLLASASPEQRIIISRQLQQTYGNKYVQRVVESMKAQKKPTLSDPNDNYEKEADQIAERVVQWTSPEIYSQGEQAEEEDNESAVKRKPVNNIQRQEDEEETQSIVLQPQGEAKTYRQAKTRGSETPEITWEKKHPEGRVDKLAPGHYIFWNFAVGERALKSEFETALEEIAKQWPIYNLAGTGKIEIHGHTSSSGAEKLNSRLSWKRAVTTKSYLWEHKVNIPWERLVVTAHGESEPRFANVSPSSMARNRRVEIKLTTSYTPTPVRERDDKEPEKKGKEENLLKDVWLGVGESHSGDLFVIGAHSAAAVVFNLGDEWPKIRWAAVNVSGYKFGPGLGGSVGACFVLVNGVSRVSDFTSLTPGGLDFDAALGAKLKGWLSSIKGVSKVIKTLDDYKKLRYVGEQALKNTDLAQPGLHAFAVPMAGAGLHVWLGYKFGEVQVIKSGVLGGKK